MLNDFVSEGVRTSGRLYLLCQRSYDSALAIVAKGGGIDTPFPITLLPQKTVNDTSLHDWFDCNVDKKNITAKELMKRPGYELFFEGDKTKAEDHPFYNHWSITMCCVHYRSKLQIQVYAIMAMKEAIVAFTHIVMEHWYITRYNYQMWNRSSGQEVFFCHFVCDF